MFFGWWTVLVTGIISGFGHGFYTFGISVFFKDLAAELGLNRAVTSLATGIGRLEGGITSPLTGWLSDKYGPKWVIFTGICLSGSGMILMNFINGLWQYLVVWGVFIGVGLNIGLTVAVDKALNDWFILRRGLAQGSKFALIGVGSIIVVPAVTLLATGFGWRITCLIWGCVMLACSPLSLLFVKQKRPEFYGLLPDGNKKAFINSEESDPLRQDSFILSYDNEEIEFSFKQAFKTRAYWLLAVAFGIQMLILGGISVHIVPFLTDIGISKTTAGAMLSMLVFFSIPSRFFGGVLADRLNKQNLPRAIGISMMIMAFGIGLFLVYQNLFSVFVFLILMGLCGGLYTPILTVALGRYYGRNSFGSIFGVLRALQAPLAFAAPAYSGWVYDTTGSYVTAFNQFAILLVVSSICLLSIRPPMPKGIDQ